MIQLLCHLWGDYILQSDWMAQNKTKVFWPAYLHALLYSATFIVLTRSLIALGVIFVTHFLIDRFRLARYLVWAKNWMGPRKAWYFVHGWPAIPEGWTDVDQGLVPRTCTQTMPPLSACPTGYPPTAPAWLSTWLLIVADNTLHLTINFLALRYL